MLTFLDVLLLIITSVFDISHKRGNWKKMLLFLMVDTKRAEFEIKVFRGERKSFTFAKPWGGRSSQRV